MRNIGYNNRGSYYRYYARVRFSPDGEMYMYNYTINTPVLHGIMKGNAMEYKYRVGISGGTFDPIHYGHLIVAEQAREKFNLDRVLFIPTGNPPHKNAFEITEAGYRFNMVESSVRSNRFFEASRIEIDRKGHTYTVDTLNQLREIYGQAAGLYFIIGADVVFDLLTWKKAEEVFKQCEFIAVLRPGFEEKSFRERIYYLKKEYSAVIHTMEALQIEISSTEIRRRIREGLSIKYLVPECVEEYIAGKGLYGRLE